MKKLQQISSAVFLSLAIFFFTSTPAHAQDGTWTGVCVGSTTPGDSAYQVATIQGLQCLIGNVLSIAVTGIGLLGFAMLIYGSFKILLSGGTSQTIDSGKNTMTFAIVGLVVALSAFIILNLLSSFTGVKAILNFQIPGSDTPFR